MICADSSVVAKLLFPKEHHFDVAQRLLTDHIAQHEPIIAPFPLRDEVANVVRKKLRYERFPPAEIDTVLDDFLSLPIAFRDPDGLFHAAVRIAVEYNLPAIYDAEYIALARLTDCEFWTADLDLIYAVKRHLPFVWALSEYEPAP